MNADPTRIMKMASAYYDSAVLFAASDVGIFAELAKSPADSRTLARQLNLDERGTRLLLNGCVAVGLLQQQDGIYSNAPDSASFLVPGRPGDLSGAIRYNRDVYPAWGRLRELARTGRPVELPDLHLGSDAERTRTFVLSMHGRALGIGMGVVPHLDLVGRRRLLDVGGGPGTYSVLIARRFESIACTVLDLPAVAEIAAELIAQQGMTDRVRAVGADYHTAEFPAGVDAVNFFGVLHQESAGSIRALFERAYRAMDPGGIVHVLDLMTDHTHAAPPFSALFAVNMALTTDNGWVFSDSELKTWIQEAGFTGFELIPLPPPMPHWLARAYKPLC